MLDEETVSRIFQEKYKTPIDIKTLRATVKLLTKIEASRVDGFVPVTETESVEKVVENLKAITESVERISWAFSHARRHSYSENLNARYKI
jgi:hypothetical protein